MINEKEKIEKVNFNEVTVEREYDRCYFENCDFSKMKIYDIDFDECVFKDCNLSLTKFANNLRDCEFIECKITGSDFTEMSKFSSSLNFTRCNLSYASFAGIKASNSIFIECELNEASFDRANLTSSTFDKCDLTRASFIDSNIEKVNFYSSYNFSINPNHCKIKGAIFCENELRGLLTHLNIKILK